MILSAGLVAFLQNFGCFLVALVCLKIVRPARNPLGLARAAAMTMLRKRWYLAAWGAYVAVIGTDIALTSIDDRFTRWVGRDFTAQIQALEGPLLIHLQSLATPALDWATSVIYLVIFPQAILLSLVLFTAEEDKNAMKQLLAGFFANYLLALPFYCFFPVQEAHAFDPRILLRMDFVHPRLMQAYRPMSGIDNCFPSLHTSLALTAFLVARDHLAGRGRLSWLIGWVAGLTIFSVFYLGIHWVTDAAAGALLAILCHRVSRRFRGDNG